MDKRQENYGISDEDLRAALREIKTYMDITEEDLRRIYTIALRHARERLAQKIQVSDVMTRDVIAVKKDTDIHEAARLLSDNRISGLPVIDEESHVIGIVTEADILHRVGVRVEHRFKDILRHLIGEPLPKRRAGERVEDIMVSPPITIKPDADIREVATILDEKRIKRLPVVDNENKLVGIISRADIVRAVGS